MAYFATVWWLRPVEQTPMDAEGAPRKPLRTVNKGSAPARLYPLFTVKR